MKIRTPYSPLALFTCQRDDALTIYIPVDRVLTVGVMPFLLGDLVKSAWLRLEARC